METHIFHIVGRLSCTHAEYAEILRKKGAKDVKKRFTKSVTHVLVADVTDVPDSVRARSDVDIVDEKWLTAKPDIVSTRPHLQFRVTLANKFKKQNVDGWLFSEKLDGVRAVWDGYQFWSRSGNPINVPDSFVRDFPQVTLDGELYGGRQNFDTTSGIVRTKNGTYEQWQTLNFHVFDCPDMEQYPFTERYGYLQKLIQGRCHLKLCEQTPINKADIPEKLAECIAEGGEGLMLRKPDSLYEFKRTSSLLKVKQMHDAEAVVIGYEDGTGKYRGLCGSLMCEYRGKMFKCGSGLTDEQRANPPKIGTKITFGYFEIGISGVPRFPTFKRVFEGRV
jgi:DNA ligase-1